MRAATFRRALASAAVVAALSGCATVERIAADAPRELSGNWNDTDSRLVSEEMLRELRAWVETDTLLHRRAPTVVVGNVRDLTGERINVATFLGDIERALVQSGRASVVASWGERAGVREERRDQDYNAAEPTRKPMGKERGADFLLGGAISAIVDRNDTFEVRYYQVDLALIDLTDSTKAWVGQKKIKKIVRRSPVSDRAAAPLRDGGGARFASQGSGDLTGMSSRIRHYACANRSVSKSCW